MQQERPSPAGGARTGSNQSPARKRQRQAASAGSGGPQESTGSMLGSGVKRLDS